MEGLKLPEHIENPDPNIYLRGNYVTTDFETTNKSKGTATNRDNSIVLSVWKDVQLHSSWHDEFQLQGLVQSVEKASFTVAHNAKFELQWLSRCGADLTRLVVWDTMIAEYCIQGNRKVPLNLDAVAERYGLGTKVNSVNSMIKGGICPSEIHRPWLLKYCIQDVVLTEKIFKKQLQWIMENNPELLNVIYTRCLLTPVLADIEFNGVYLDAERVEEEYQTKTKEYNELTGLLESYAGGLNWNSPKQVAEYIYDQLGFSEPTDRRGNAIRTESGQRSASVSTLALLAPRNKRQREFLRIYKKRNKVKAALIKSLEFFKGVVDERGCIFDASFNQAVTGTHRLSSSGRPYVYKRDDKKRSVQFQNLPRDYKRLFRARNEGWLIGECDGAQLEFRVAAFLGQDDRAKQDIIDGVDVHQFTANTIGCTRQEAKADTFKPLYGGTSGTTAQQRYYKAFKEKYADITRTQQGWVDEVLRTKQLKTCTGLVFYCPTTRTMRSGYVVNNESIHNYPVQMFATADIIPVALVYQWHMMKASSMDSFIINTIHDSSITEVHPKENELYKEIVVKAFTEKVIDYLDTVYNIQFNVPLGTGVKLSSNWGEGTEIKNEYKSRHC